MKKNIIFVIKTNQEYIRFIGNEYKENEPLLNSFYESISSVYIPLLNMLERLDSDNNCKLALVFTPSLLNLLSNHEIQNHYIEYLDKKLLLGKSELKRCAKNPALIKNINEIIQKTEKVKSDFVNKYQKDIISKYNEYYQEGKIELLATCATDVFMPHYPDMSEIISAQIETGLHAFRSAFSQNPDGFWIPELGYTKGVEKIIRGYSYLYTIVDARSLLLSTTMPENGIFYPVRTDNSLVVFANDPELHDELFGSEGIINDSSFKNLNKDIGFDLPVKNLSAFFKEGDVRYATGFQYYNKNFNEDDKGIYNEKEAVEKARQYARDFMNKKGELLSKASKVVKKIDFVNLVCTLDADLFLKNWSEGIYFLEEALSCAREFDLNVTTCNHLLEKQFMLDKVVPYYSSCEGEGYGENLLSNKNCWMMRYIRKASERMIDLADRFPNDTGLKTRLLNIAAIELMIAQSSGLLKMIENEEFPEYAAKRFKQSISAFTSVFDSLGSNTVSTEWLTTLEIKDNLFPWMNYRIFSRKK